MRRSGWWTRWRALPRWARWTVGGYAALLAWGGGVHVVDLAVGGTGPYPWAPWWMAAYLVSLTVADPVATVLLLARRRAGMDLACLILVTDAAANGWALYALGGGDAVTRVGHATATAVALGSLVARRALRPHLLPGRAGTDATDLEGRPDTAANRRRHAPDR
ncbi:hypothetical protein ACL02O_08900 [Micromonospora sp. MS34]|uniref:hypothetical protein n=1 Tax=Micromonospora sp. MS34 TaxID=3385971 RepID=UPI0039A10200